MSIVTKVVAYCDAVDIIPGGGTRDCFTSVALRSNTTQPFIDLARLGWTLHHSDEGTQTVCPNHGEEV